MVSMIDEATGRRLSWDGAVVQDLSPRAAHPGWYWRVTQSHRDPNTGEWGIYGQDYIGPNPPYGEPIYRFDGTTWDMKAAPSTVFPWLFAAVSFVIAMTLCLLWVWYIKSGDPQEPAWGLVPIFVLAWGVNTGLKWMRNIEPVSGTAATVAFTAATVARAEHLRAQEEARVNAAITEANRRAQAQDAAAFAKWEANGSVGPAPIPTAAPLQYPGPKQWS